MEGLDFNNILDPAEIENLFVDDGDGNQEEGVISSEEPADPSEGSEKNNKSEKTTEVVDVNNLFADQSESVGSEENNEGKEDPSLKGDGTSPNNFYSSIAKALKEEGIFPDLEDDDLSKIKAPSDFRDIVEKQIQAGLDEKQKRIDTALGVGIEPNQIRQYENTIAYLNSIQDNQITDESDNGEKLRKNLIYQDFLNRGYSKERATREVKKSLDAGTDIEDAREALKSNLDFFKESYNDLIEDAKEDLEEAKKKQSEENEKLKKAILEDKNIFDGIEIDKATRQKVYDAIVKPVYKDSEGRYYNALQKYSIDHPADFSKNIALLFTLTNGFKSLDKLVKGKVNKEVRKGLRELERTLNNTSRDSDGNLKFVSGVNDDPEAFIGKGWQLDV